ncbi:MAG: glycoside hydrolase family 88 protein [Thermomicrobiales bacterium]
MTEDRYAAALDACVETARCTLARVDGFPYWTAQGRWLTEERGRWTGGHWLGIIWMAYLRTGDPALLEAAYAWSRRLAPRQHDTTTHDIGFLFYPSFVRGYRITGDPYFRDAALTAAASLATRFNPAGGYLQAWDDAGKPENRGRTIIDTAMNLPFLLWAADEADEPRYREIALRVADTTAAHHVRPDGSTFHVVDFDSETGAATRYGTHQGLHDTSHWARGQAWAIYGFSVIARMSGEERFREVAERAAESFLAAVAREPGRAPAWDFADPDPARPRDASAGAIAADGLLDLDTPERAAQGRALLDTLLAACVPAPGSDDEGLLLHQTGDLPHGNAIDVSLIYGDHYFMETLFRLTDPAASVALV